MNSPKATKDHQQNQKKARTKTQPNVQNRFVPDRPKIFSLDCCRQRLFYNEYYHLLDQPSALHAHFLKYESQKTGLNLCKRIIFVDSDTKFQQTLQP